MPYSGVPDLAHRLAGAAGRRPPEQRSDHRCLALGAGRHDLRPTWIRYRPTGSSRCSCVMLAEHPMDPLRTESLGYRLPPGPGLEVTPIGLVRALRDKGVRPSGSWRSR